MKNSYTKSNITFYYHRSNIITVTYALLAKSNLVIYYIKLKSHPSELFWSSESQLSVLRSMSNLLEIKRPSSGNAKLFLKGLNPSRLLSMAL